MPERAPPATCHPAGPTPPRAGANVTSGTDNFRPAGWLLGTRAGGRKCRWAGLACACVTDHDFGPWAAEAWPKLADAVLAAFT